jgi:hypothetical protein
MTPGGAWRSIVRTWDRIPVREPWRLLLPLLVAHWVSLVVYTTRVNHNAWLFYQGGDQIWYWTTGWLVGRGEISEPFVSQGWPLAIVPFSWIGGPGFLGGLPGIMLLQILVLAPIALWCVYELGQRIGGRAIGYVSAAVWTLGPYVAVPLFVHRYHDRYVDQFLPLPLGLTAMADYASTVCLLASAVLTVRAVETRDPGTAVLAGLTFGFAALMKPSNLVYAPAPFVLLLAARRWRELLVAGAAVAPAVVALAIWKYRGYGYMPAFAYQETHSALGPDTLTAPIDKYVNIKWDNIHSNLDGLREFFWSVRVLQWLPFAGAIAIARRSVPLALFFSAWFWAFFIIKGSADEATVESGSFFRFLLPAMPAFLLLAAAVPLLVPKYGIQLARRTPASTPRRARRWAVITATVLLGLVPIVAAAAATPLQGPKKVLQYLEIGVPVDDGLALGASVRKNGTVRLDWRRPKTNGSRVFYKLFRSPAATDTVCFNHDPGADTCTLVSVPRLVLRKTETGDRPGRGTWTYRVGVAANWVDDPDKGDVFLLSEPVTVTVP